MRIMCIKVFRRSTYLSNLTNLSKCGTLLLLLLIILSILSTADNTVDSRYLEFQGTLKYFEISVLRHCRTEEKLIRLTTFNRYMLKFRSNFSSFSQYFLHVVRFSGLGRDQIFTSR